MKGETHTHTHFSFFHRLFLSSKNIDLYTHVFFALVKISESKQHETCNSTLCAYICLCVCVCVCVACICRRV